MFWFRLLSFFSRIFSSPSSGPRSNLFPVDGITVVQNSRGFSWARLKQAGRGYKWDCLAGHTISRCRFLIPSSPSTITCEETEDLGHSTEVSVMTGSIMNHGS